MPTLEKHLAEGRYLQRLTDDTGIFQHTKFGIPDRSKGYTSDDNARALLAAALLAARSDEESVLKLAGIYLSFLYHAQNPDGSFRNFMDYNRSFLEEKGSEDCLGRCLWALGRTLTMPHIPENMKNACRYMINRALPVVPTLISPRAKAYAIVGLSYLAEGSPDRTGYRFPKGHPAVQRDPGERFLPADDIRSHIAKLADELTEQYQGNKSGDWLWFEDVISYSNALLPWGLLRAYQATSRREYRDAGAESLGFLTAKTFTGGRFKPVGCHGWFPRGGKPAAYDEQPIEACETLLACREAHSIFKDDRYQRMARQCLEWYHGRNSLGVSLIDAETGACYDGIHAGGLNLNQGSENIVSYIIANLVMADE